MIISIAKKLMYVASIFAFVATFVSCSSDNNESEIETPSQVLSSTPWETTGAKDKDGNSVALTDPNVSGFVGFSYFKGDGNFAIYGLNDVLRSRGTWSVSADGKTRTITALKPDGTTLFTRVVDILVLNKNEFTYRIHANPNDSSVFYDIKHSKVSHAEPNLGQLILASTPWEMTAVKDKNGNPVALTDPKVSGFVGYSYFRANGTYAIYGLNNVLRSQGTWSISPDGKTRTITAIDANGNVIFTRIVDILTLNNAEFTYRIVPDATNNPAEFYDITHKPVNHLEP
ncbi:DUF4822 domain-containing protein [Chryseobacterium geocarposphaerae]|uniref:Uncharacterized protein DUF4822 n=1 Tax=Chryseobacterium geocarposphaerae TaxID=1416776 RepID=A0A2M9CB32_9FLAO|nr:DUF4822 domain-containing protein [Chryseobacterium geocarposphaerae]PJJ68058.1 uncharacterized protein DUF4822 [Chryseobacterium geocarposphaerae]